MVVRDHPSVEHPPILNVPHPYVITSNEAMGPEDEQFSKEKNTQSIAHVPHVEPPVMVHHVPYQQVSIKLTFCYTSTRRVLGLTK